MKKEVDETLSKRPLDVPDDVDLKGIEESIHLAQKNLDNAVNELEARQHEKYLNLIKSNHARLVDIAMNAIQLQPNDVINLAKARGQFAERIILANEVLSWQNTVLKEKSALKRLGTLLEDWRKRVINNIKEKSNA